ncbi:MAG: SAM-dependent methyltransferase [Thiohalocapsa sp.]|jgi:SAM-dependent MidA family methyltransferase|uniref:class I SAM-dependent methyltransferase n=1 Tax=Thiohalocapsa sp. TaxID=2497641 RepID=UPI0025EE2B54|nr:SAM-dependent methyltransferase [Thiohalocapsa sp.]MCG6943119.1 SAM-dependent methyltransferase [Thiohalocapsa sp.]
MTAQSERLRALIRQEISAAGGALPFDRFMELALYAPGLGYYAAGATKLGPAGDFVTAPEISPLFGRCIATQCAEVLAALGGGDLLELGAGSGALAADVLETLAEADRLPGRYLILEPSPDLAERQRALIEERVPALSGRVHWISRPPAELRGMVIANEVLDAMPVHRFCLPPLDAARPGASADVAAAVREVLVRRDGDRFADVLDTPRSPRLAAAVAALDLPPASLARGLCSELNLRLAPWLAMLAGHLAAGMLLLIDYGYPRREYYLPERRDGTLLCHYRHQAHADPYAHPGLQDITAHVDFSAVAAAGMAAGLALAGYTTQANFLLGCGLDRHLSAAATDPEALLDLAASAKQLVLPAAMGERFQAIALTRNLEAPRQGWCGFAQRDLRGRL